MVFAARVNAGVKTDGAAHPSGVYNWSLQPQVAKPHTEKQPRHPELLGTHENRRYSGGEGVLLDLDLGSILCRRSPVPDGSGKAAMLRAAATCTPRVLCSPRFPRTGAPHAPAGCFPAGPRGHAALGPTPNSTPCFLHSPPSRAKIACSPLRRPGSGPAAFLPIPLRGVSCSGRAGGSPRPSAAAPSPRRGLPPDSPSPAPPAPRALTSFAAARTRLSSPPPPASASRPGCCACSPCARRCRCGRAGTRRAPGPSRAGTRPCWWSESGTATPAAGSVYSPGTWSASARAPCLGTATGTGSASCCVCCSWCVWSGTSCGSETGPSFRAALRLTAGLSPARAWTLSPGPPDAGWPSRRSRGKEDCQPADSPSRPRVHGRHEGHLQRQGRNTRSY